MADNKPDPKNAEKKLSVLEQYLYANLLWFGFLAALCFVSFFACGAVWDDVFQGVLEFILYILGGGFILVSALDYMYEKHVARSVRDGKS